MTTPSESPSDSARIPVVPTVSTRRVAACADPVAVLAALRQSEGLGRRHVLLESAGSPDGEDRPATVQRSILVARPLLHLELRGGEAVWRGLIEGAEPLLAAVARGSGGVVAEGQCRAVYPSQPHRGLLPDGAVLRLPSALDALRLTAGLLEDRGASPLPPGAFGAISYELVDHFEALPPRAPDPLDEPDLSFVLAGDVVVWDHEAGEVHVITRALGGEERRAAAARHDVLVGLVATAGSAIVPTGEPQHIPWEADLDADAFEAVVSAFLREVRDGDIFQGVPSRHFSAEATVDPLAVYTVLRAANPSPYMFVAELGDDGALVGASPETCVRVADGNVDIRPIAGTVPRGRNGDGTIDADLDGRLALSMLLDQKEQAEHAMLVDLARNDVARVCLPGSTTVIQQMVVEKYQHVQHMVSRVRGRLRPGLDALHAYRAAANMGTLTGAPKVRAMTSIRRAEPTARGFYGGALGYLLADGTFDSCIVIRSLRIKDGTVHTRAGAGVVAASVPARERAETEHKARAVRAAVEQAVGSAMGGER